MAETDKVDDEYKRAGDVATRVQLSAGCDARENGVGNPLAVPDVIVNQRGDDGPEHRALELKKTSNSGGWACDRERVHAFREHLDYEFAVLIECETRAGQAAAVTVAEWVGE